MNVEVVGVSGDSVSNHQLFKKKESLGITLLADEDGKVAEAFGVPFTPGEKSVKATIDGKEETLVRGVTSKRWTFIVGKDGKIVHKNEMVNAAEDKRERDLGRQDAEVAAGGLREGIPGRCGSRNRPTCFDVVWG